MLGWGVTSEASAEHGSALRFAPFFSQAVAALASQITQLLRSQDEIRVGVSVLA